MLKLHKPNFIKFVLLTVITTSVSFAQDDLGDFTDEAGQTEKSIITLTGTVSDGSGKKLPGANVFVSDSDLGAATDENGNFSIEGVETGSEVTASVIGYDDLTLFADSEVLDFVLTSSVIQMSSLEVLSSRAGEDTPVAFTNINKEELNIRLGSRDIPLALNTVPSVYSTGQGGGAGDARINVRGFNQRNVAIMLNGIPVNDMENGWVYWSNWDGVADATSSIQMQKGLSAVNLATPSIGGSMNIITDPAAQDRRGLFKQEVGAFGFLKTTLSGHSGLLMNDKLALSATLVRKTGTGYVKGTWTDAWAYYFGASYNASENHRFEFYALGAPQRHGQNLYKQNIAAYDKSFAEDLFDDFDKGYYNSDALYDGDNGEFVEVGRDFNQNVSDISEESQAILDAAGGQHWQMYSVRDGVERHEKDNLAERENFFHKPQVAVNHYWTLNDQMNVSSSLYFSGGMGGGTGTYGDVARVDANGDSDLRTNKHKFYYGPSPWVWDFDGTIAANASDASNTVIWQGDTVSRGDQESIGILRNSNNRQSTIGLLSKLNYDLSSSLKLQVGVDYRTAKIYHVKTIRDLLGGQYFVNTDSDYDSVGTQKGLGDPIDYNFTNYVDWLGFFGQGSYKVGDLSAFAMAGLTTVKYTHWNHFKRASDYSDSYIQSKDGSDASWVDGGGNKGELYIEADPLSTFQFKGGVMYGLGDMLSFFNAIPVFGKLSDKVDAWFNFGISEKVPVFDQVIQDWDAKMSSDPKNESFTAFEFGLNAYSNDGTMAAKLNLYSTTWSDRIETKSVQNLETSDNDIVYITGISQAHSGVEIELSAQVHPMVRLDIGAGLGNWVFTDDATGTYRDDSVDVSYNYALKDLKVGDMPQASFITGVTINPTEGASVRFQHRYYSLHYSDWSPSGREFTDESNPDRLPAWRAPDYGVLDLHASYDLPFKFGSVSPQLYLHVFNLLDAVYIQDAVDNSQYNSWDKTHGADDAEVYFGLPTSYNIGLTFNF